MTTQKIGNPVTGFIQTSLGGTALATAYPPSFIAGGTVLYDEDSGAFYIRAITPGTTTAAWKLLSGAGGGLSSKYWVSNSAAGPTAGYTTATSAIAAAVADGHNGTDPATICFLPGIYTSPATLPAGISLMGLSGGNMDGGVSPVTLLGNMSITGTSGTNSISNLFFAGAITIGGGAASQPIVVLFDNAWLSANNADLISINATDVVVKARNSEFDASNGIAIRPDSAGSGCSGSFFNCKFSTSAQPCVRVVDSGWTYQGCQFYVSGAAPYIVEGYSAAAATAVGVDFIDCLFKSDGDAATQWVMYENSGLAASQYRIWGKGTTISGFPAGVVLLFGALATVYTRGGPHLGNFTFANRPTNLLASLDNAMPTAWISNGRKIGEGLGAGTGVFVYWNQATTTWLTFSQDIVVAA